MPRIDRHSAAKTKAAAAELRKKGYNEDAKKQVGRIRHRDTIRQSRWALPATEASRTTALNGQIKM